MIPSSSCDLSALLLFIFFFLEFIYFEKLIAVWMPLLFQVICGTLLCRSFLLENCTFATLILSLLFGVCLAVISYSLQKGTPGPLDKTLRFSFDSNNAFPIIRHYAIHALSEELFWRGAMTSLLGRSPLTVILISTLFSIAHMPKMASLTALFEVLAFAVLLHIFYLLTGSIFATSLLHAARNIVLIAIRQR